MRWHNTILSTETELNGVTLKYNLATIFLSWSHWFTILMTNTKVKDGDQNLTNKK